MSINKTISNWANALLNPTVKDLLVNVNDSKRFFNFDEKKTNHSLEITPALKQIILESKKNKRNLGLDALCKITDILVWEWKGKRIQTPLFLTPVTFKESKLNNTIDLSFSYDGFFNPFLIKYFEVEINFEASPEDVKETLEQIACVEKIIETTGLANIHHHRFSIIKELELLAQKNLSETNLAHLLGYGKAKPTALTLSNGFLFETDADQLTVFNKVQENNLLIYGPPGTGKSQVIANLLTKSVAHSNITALVAEKTAALTVIFDKLKPFDLHHLCALYYGPKSNSQNILNLKESYLFFEKLTVVKEQTFDTSQQKIDQLQQKLNRLNTNSSIGNVAYKKYREITKSCQETSTETNFLAPDIATWLKHKQTINKLFSAKINFEQLAKIKHLSSFTIKQLEQFAEQLNKIIPLIEDSDLSVNELDEELKNIHFTKLFFYNGKALEKELLKENSTVQKRFFKLYKTFIKQKEQLTLLEKEKQNWKEDLSATEITAFLTALNTRSVFNLKARNAKRTLAKISTHQMANFNTALINLQAYQELQLKHVALKDKLRKLNIEPDKATLLSLNSMLNRVNAFDKNKIEEVARKTIAQKLEMLEKEPMLLAISDFLKRVQLSKNEPIKKQLQNLRIHLPSCIENLSLIKSLNNLNLNFLGQYQGVDYAEAVVLHTAYQKFKGLNPSLANFDGQKLKTNLNEIERLKKDSFLSFANLIKATIKDKFNSYHALLDTPATKLNTAQKELKVKLRKGKAILVKEFAKSKQHKSPLSLNSSDAKLWIDLLQPIKLLNTYQVGTDFLQEQNTFDLLIFDEASQLPLANSFGSIYRAKRVVVAGDPEQMTPSNYFKTGFDNIDLLHQAQYNFESTKLKHHYRCSHPALIHFSNTHFYNNDLKVFPRYNNTKPIELIKCNGIYSKNGNLEEAKIAAEIIASKLIKKDTDFGVVAFSEKQLQLIYAQLNSTQQIELDLLVENGLLFKALENVQGDECKHLIISLGYGYNEAGKFEMRFGPVNQHGGGKRLNVLFSRAQDKLTLIHSVNAADFKLSENNGVDLLRKFMQFVSTLPETETTLNFTVQTKQTENKLTILEPYAAFNSVNELYTFYTVLQNRGWEVLFEI